MRSHRAFLRSQEGSALVFALLGLVFLTVIGLSLAVVTETEMLIGTNEQISQETFYAAEAGVATATTKVLNGDTRRQFFAMSVKDEDEEWKLPGDRVLGYSVDFTDVYPVAFDVAPMTGANEGSDKKLLSMFFRFDVRARRLSWKAEDEVPDCDSIVNGSPPLTDSFDNIQAEKRLSVGFFVTPIERYSAETLWDSFHKPDTFGCAEELEDDDYIQTIP